MELFTVIMIIIRDITKIKHFTLIFPKFQLPPVHVTSLIAMGLFPLYNQLPEGSAMFKNALTLHIYPWICQKIALLMKVSMLNSFPREERNYFSWKGKIILSLQMLDTAQEHNPWGLFFNSLWVQLCYLPMHIQMFSLGMLIIFQSVGPWVNSHTREGTNIFRTKSACLKDGSCLSGLHFSECSPMLYLFQRECYWFW